MANALRGQCPAALLQASIQSSVRRHAVLAPATKRHLQRRALTLVTVVDVLAAGSLTARRWGNK